MSPPTAETNEMQFAPNGASPASARAFAERYLHAHDLSYIVDDAGLVVTELVTNAVVHAERPIRVTIEEMPFCVKLTVHDHAVDLAMPSLAERVNSDDETGRGSWVVDACSADWGTALVGDGDKYTWALFAVRPKSSWVDHP